MRPLLFIGYFRWYDWRSNLPSNWFRIQESTSPGSFIVYCLNAPKGEFLHMVLGVFLATCFIRS